MAGMFQVSAFNQDISNWNVQKVTDMISMFRNSDFNQDISNWEIGNVKDMRHMFRNTAFNQDIHKWWKKLRPNCDIRYMFLDHKLYPDIERFEEFSAIQDELGTHKQWLDL